MHNSVFKKTAKSPIPKHGQKSRIRIVLVLLTLHPMFGARALSLDYLYSYSRSKMHLGHYIRRAATATANPGKQKQLQGSSQGQRENQTTKKDNRKNLTPPVVAASPIVYLIRLCHDTAKTQGMNIRLCYFPVCNCAV